jgi:hypothetical protein
MVEMSQELTSVRGTEAAASDHEPARTLDEEFGTVDRTVFSIVSSFEEADAADRKYWQTRTPYERLRYLEYLRRMNYGHRATTRLQRILEVVAQA